MIESRQHQGLFQRWQALCARLGLAGMTEGAWEVLVAAYTEPLRAYHNLTHIAECLAHLNATSLAPAECDIIELALWFHDAVYDTHRHDNEEASAALAELHLTHAGAPATLQAHVSRLILATRHNATPVEMDSRWIVDIDLAILGTDRVRFDEYEHQIREEYYWVPAEDFRKGRATVLRKFLEREAIYLTPPFHARLENAARQNLQRSLKALAV
jgi:predicted metal-dependent HD superfamily phosphohydrolase